MSFPEYTIESAPTAAQRLMTAVRDHLGYLPTAVTRLATSPHTLDGFLKLNAIFDSSTMEPLAREVLIMTVATRNGCHLCVAMHTERLTSMDADPGLIAELRAGTPLSDAHLEAVRLFTQRVLETTGDVGDDALRAFLAHGYTHQNALEVALGIGTYTLSTLANRLVAAPVDPPLTPYAWHHQPA
jgi:AhpD family alkylhydroperoxidase